MSDSNRVGLRFIEEASWGATPAGNFQALRFVDETFNLDKEALQSDEIRDDGNISDLVDVGYNASGGFNFEFSANTYDLPIESVLRSAFTTPISFAGVTTVSTASADNSINDSAAGLPLMAVGQWINISGFTQNSGENNGYVKVVSSSVLKIVVSHKTLTDEAAGDAVTLKSSMIRNATTQKSFSIEKAALDVNQFFMNLGMVASSMSMSFASRSKVTGNFSFLGSDVTRDTSAAATVDAATTTDILNSSGHVASIQEAGGSFTCQVTQLNMNINPNVRGRPAVGSPAYCSIGDGSLVVTGDLTIYFQNGNMWDKFKAGTPSDINWALADASGNGYMFTLPKIKFGTSEIVAGGINTDMLAKFNYQAVLDPVTNCSIQIDAF